MQQVMKPRGVRKVVIDDIIASGADPIMAHRHLREDAGREGRGRGGGGEGGERKEWKRA